MGSISEDVERYLLTRDRVETDRLEMQHSALQANIGYLLHPDIPQRNHMRIADIGTGTGVWLRDLQKQLPNTCILDGFDISLDQVPDRDLFPTDINYYAHDILAPFPAEFWGQYDVVNVRLLTLGLKDNEWEPAIQNLTTLLRPGGYLQWGDIAMDTGLIKTEIPGSNVDDAERFLRYFRQAAAGHGKTGTGARQLYPLFERCGLQDCKEEICSLDKPEMRATLNAATAKGIEHALKAALKADRDGGALPASQIVYDKNAAIKNMKETKSWISHDMHIVIGRRA
ncbi:hypothetical protein FQN53_004184 [Emmonsiellopsis sp. PD_33]|nr:hypothetical protein FQN53_004184 [Emmonsiellopsis sp. PD_33]KAK2795952.1 hypothetical protein FQN51_009610 [Onygenales sp. PD_10]